MERPWQKTKRVTNLTMIRFASISGNNKNAQTAIGTGDLTDALGFSVAVAIRRSWSFLDFLLSRVLTAKAATLTTKGVGTSNV